MFTVNLSTPANATIAVGTGTGTIVNDNGAPPAPASTPIPTLNPWNLLALATLLFLIALWGTRTRQR